MSHRPAEQHSDWRFGTGGRADWLSAAAVALVALLTYVRTLAPGLVAATADSAAFQFVGKVLGTVHNPGYPTYVLITHAWSYLPVGSLAYRINLFSAVMGSIAVAGTYALCRALGIPRLIAAAGALAFAFGRIFWSQAVVAEVYTLNAALVAWSLLFLLTWEKTGKSSHFFLAVGVMALGFGNHVTIVLMVPAVILFALLTDWRFTLRPGTMAASLAILFAGLLPYALILIRSSSRSAYLESRATNLHQLFAVMRGAQFESAMASFSPSQVLTERLPMVVQRFLAAELTWPVLMLAVIGAGLLLFRRVGLPILVSTLAVLVFVVNYDAGDLEVFAIPAILLLWVCAAFAAGQLQRLATRHGRAGAAAVSLAALTFAAWQGVRYFDLSDMSHDREADRYMDAAIAALPDRSVVLREDFLVDRMVMYKVLGEGAAAGRLIRAEQPEPERIAAARSRGFHIYAFAGLASRLRFAGLDVGFAALAVPRLSVEEVLSDQRPGTLATLAVSAMGARGFAAHAPGLWSLADPRTLLGQDQAAWAVAGSVGDPNAGVVRTGVRGARAESNGVGAQADATWAAVFAGPRDLASSDAGAVLGLWDRGRRLLLATALDEQHGFTVPLSPGALSLHEVRGQLPEQAVNSDWSEIKADAGVVILRVTPGASVTLHARSSAPLDLRVHEYSGGSPDLQDTTAGAASDDPPGGVHEQQLVVSVPRGAAVPVSLMITAGGRAVLRARAEHGAASVIPLPLDGILEALAPGVEWLVMARTIQAVLLGAGWSAVEGDEAGPYRWMSGDSARLLLPTRQSGSIRTRIQARLAGEGPAGIEVVLDGRTLGAREMTPGWNWYEWTIPASSSSPRLHDVIVRRTPRPGGQPQRLAVSQVRLDPVSR